MSRHTKAPQSPVAYSYVRFSHPDQAKGDSLRRQTEKRDEWLRRNGVTLDTSLTLRDEGVSAFTGDHRDNPDRHGLAAFLKLVESGRVAEGSYLVVENLDRLSREDIIPALSLVLNLIQAGIRLVQLLPVEMVYDKQSNPMHLMMAIMELSRGHSESALKSERVGGAWQEKKRLAAAERVPLTARCPAWLRLVDGKWEVNKEAAATIRQIYRWAVEGYGLTAITKRLNANKVPVVGPALDWARSYVAKLLSNPAVMGQYQPYTGRGRKRQPDGNPIPGYYPAVVTEAEWFAARGAMVNRRGKAGQPAKVRLNLFANLLRDARDGSGIHLVNKYKKKDKEGDKGGDHYLLVSYRASQGANGSKYVSFPLEVFEPAVLSCLREINPRDLLPDQKEIDKTLALSGKLAEVEGRIERLKARLKTDDDLDTLVDAVRELEAKRKRLAQELGRAQQEAASPLAEAWASCRNLAETLDKAPDPAAARVKLRSAIRRIIEGVWCLFVARGATRLAAVQIWFTGGARRDYLILRQPAKANGSARKEAQWWVRSLATVAKPGDLDLRKRDHARRLEKALAGAVLGDLGG
jgi:DNA invertase Pin-like site-specific DNA recombinase